MSIQGIEVTVTFDPPVPFTDEWVDAVYSSLEKNMAIKSVDVSLDEEVGKLLFLFGIDNFLDSEGFTQQIASDALDRAFEDAAGPNTRNKQSKFRASKVAVFA